MLDLQLWERKFDSSYVLHLQLQDAKEPFITSIYYQRMVASNLLQDDEQGIQCTAAGQGCNKWFHQQCSGLSQDAFSMIQAEPLADWVCATCDNGKTIEYVRGNP